MQRWLSAVLAAIGVLAAVLIGPGGGPTGCRFVLGFAAFAAQLPQAVGQCLEDEQHDPASGDARQHTSAGLLVWRKADNAIAFTDGSHTWVVGILGIEDRPNSQRFIWEANPEHLPLAPEVGPGVTLGPGVAAAHPAGATSLANRAAWDGAQFSVQAGTTVSLALPAPAPEDVGSLPSILPNEVLTPNAALLPDGDSVLTLAIAPAAAGRYDLVARWPDGQQGSIRLEVGATATLTTGIGNPDDLTVAPDGSVLYTDLTTNTVGQLLAGGSRRTLLGGLNVPEGLAITGPNTLLLADQGTNRVLQWTAPGGLGLLWQLSAVRGVEGIDGLSAAVISGRSTALLPDSPSGRLLLLPEGAAAPTLFPGRWQRPTDAVFQDGQLYLVDEYGGHLWRGPLQGPLQPVGPAMALPDDVIVAADGTAFVNTLGQGAAGGGIVRIAANGQSSTVLSGLNDPQGIDLDGAGNLLFAESGAGRLAAAIRSCLPLLLGSAGVSLTVGGPVQALSLGTDCSAGQPTFTLASGSRWPASPGTTWPTGGPAALTLANGARAALVAGNGAALLLLQPPTAGPGGPATLSVQMAVGGQVSPQQVRVIVAP